MTSLRSPLALRTLALACLLSLLPLSASAEGKSAAGAVPASTPEWVRLMVPKEAYDALVDQMHQQMAAAMQQRGPGGLSAEKQGALKIAMMECLPYEDLLTWSADVYAKHFSAKELKELSAFYKTPTGKKAARIMPLLNGEVMAKMSPVLMERMPVALKKHGLQ